MADFARRSRTRKLPSSFTVVVMPLVLSVFMSGIVSAVATVVNIGLGATFITNWPGAWGTSWVVAFPSLLMILPVVRRIVSAVVETPR
ncbi:DUF2798 domain-containing protein [Rhizobium sullae]|uniref:DUF2798 domain-containing protein n=1 Tax=Rhizobium sullae TaxID=50338 RepID=UPI000B35D986|nr:DUF2798 domain-containing protein [Rhizobium sullae]